MQISKVNQNTEQHISALNSPNLSTDQKFELIARACITGFNKIEDLNTTNESLKRKVSSIEEKTNEITSQLNKEKKRRLRLEADKSVETIKKQLEENEKNISKDLAKFVTISTSCAVATSTLPLIFVNPVLGLVSGAAALPAIGVTISKHFDTPPLPGDEVAELKIKEFVHTHFPEASESEDIMLRARAIGKKMHDGNNAYNDKILDLESAITETYVDASSSKEDRIRQRVAHQNRKIEGAKAEKELEKVKKEVDESIEELQGYIKEHFYTAK